jgi:hypothetical protein
MHSDPLPALLSGVEIDARLDGHRDRELRARGADASGEERHQAIATLRRLVPEISASLEPRWGTLAFETAVDALLVGEAGRPSSMPVRALEALLALADAHRAGASAQIRGIETVWFRRRAKTR